MPEFPWRRKLDSDIGDSLTKAPPDICDSWELVVNWAERGSLGSCLIELWLAASPMVRAELTASYDDSMRGKLTGVHP